MSPASVFGAHENGFLEESIESQGCSRYSLRTL
jgi:hypothetical protein